MEPSKILGICRRCHFSQPYDASTCNVDVCVGYVDSFAIKMPGEACLSKESCLFSLLIPQGSLWSNVQKSARTCAIAAKCTSAWACADVTFCNALVFTPCPS